MRNDDIAKIELLSARSDVFSIRWQVTFACNYACDFCIQGTKEQHMKLARGESLHTRMEICQRIVDIIENLKGYKEIDLHLIGGEVTMLKDFPSILEKLASCRFGGAIRFGITTNFSMPESTYIELCDIVKRHSTPLSHRQLVLSGSYYRAYTSIDDYCDKLIHISDYCRLKQRNALLRLADRAFGRTIRPHAYLTTGFPVISDEDYDLLIERKRTLVSHGIGAFPIIIRNCDTNLSQKTVDRLLDCEAKRLRVTDRTGAQTLFTKIQALGAALEDTERFCPRGYACDAGMHSVSIDAHGRVDRCPTIGGDMKLGDLLDRGFDLLKTPQVCTSDHCSCNTFGVIAKKQL